MLSNTIIRKYNKNILPLCNRFSGCSVQILYVAIRLTRKALN